MDKRCFACMNPINEAVCPHCGHNNAGHIINEEQFLRPGSIVGGRYYIGIPIDRNGEGITYIAFDNEKKVRVRVREFFPSKLCYRDNHRKDVIVTLGYEIQFKALMTDFVELSKQLISLKAHSCLLRAMDILSDNSTIYTIYEDVCAISLTKYLNKNIGELSWEDTENLFLPLLYTVKLLNSHGIVHRGISPETILVTDSNELKLKGVCTSAVRAINTEIKSELFDGCAAPEQYEKCSSHGEWTDVYALCAVLYKTLTGSMPVRADIRGMDYSLVSPIQLNSSVPKTVSDAIMKGLEWDRKQRTSYVKDLIVDLYATVPPHVKPHRIMDGENGEDEKIEKMKTLKHKRKFHMPLWLIVVLITLPLMLALFFLTYFYILGGNESSKGLAESSSNISSSEISSVLESSVPVSSEEISSRVPQYFVDNFVGMVYDDVIKSEVYSKIFKFKEKIEVYDDIVPVGEIIKQDIPKDTIIEQGKEIQLTVSKGSQYVVVPPLTDANGNAVPLEDYKKYFTDNGLKVKIKETEAYDVPAGQIVELDYSVGERLDREQVDHVTIYVADESSENYQYR